MQSTPVIHSVKHGLPVFQELSPIYRDISFTITHNTDHCDRVPFLSDLTPGVLSVLIGNGNNESTNTTSYFTHWMENTNNLDEIKYSAEDKIISSNRNIVDQQKIVLDLKQKIVTGEKNSFEKNADIQMDLDRILDKLQNMLASSFSLEGISILQLILR